MRNTQCKSVLSILAALCFLATLVIYTKEVRMQLRISETRNRTERFAHKRGNGNDVILSSYMRSGSSFLGQILGHRNDTFYFYEPLWRQHTFRYYSDSDLICEYKTPECINFTHVDREGNVLKRLWFKWKYRDIVRLPAALQYLQSIYECEFYKYPGFIQEHIHADLTLSGEGWRAFKECRENSVNIEECLQRESHVCHGSQHIVTKVLRMSPSNMIALLRSHPRLKVVHLFRDPRSVIHSHFNTEFYHLTEDMPEAAVSDIKAVCARFSKDITVLEQMVREFPGRVMVIRYEDIVDEDSFVDRVKQLYNFIGFSFSKGENESILRKFHAPKNSAGSYRELSNFTTVNYIDKQCAGVNAALGYVPFKSERDLRNQSISAVSGYLPYTLNGGVSWT